jgi:predicted RNA-binding protein YlqC (UPF0109 family)
LTDFLEILIKNLVSNPADVVINESIDGNDVYYEVFVKIEDVGRVIGKHGHIISSIRKILKAVGKQRGISYSLEIKELPTQT